MGRRASGRPRGLAIAAILACLLGSCRGSGTSAATTPPPAPTVQLLGRGMLIPRTETRQIVFWTGKRVHLIDGWSVDEWSQEDQLSFVWATARDATLWFQTLQVADQQVLVKLRAYPTEPPQAITVLVNDREIARLAPQTIFLEYRFVIPAAALHVGKNRLTFRHAALGRPIEAAPDARGLAAAYASLLMGPQCLPLRGFGPPIIPSVDIIGGRLTGPLRVVGPAELRSTLTLPPGAVLRYDLALPPRAQAAALTRVHVLDADGPHDVTSATVSRGLFRRHARQTISADLGAWGGKRVDVVIEILPEPCRTATTTAILEQAGIFSPAAAPAR